MLSRATRSSEMTLTEIKSSYSLWERKLRSLVSSKFCLLTRKLSSFNCFITFLDTTRSWRRSLHSSHGIISSRSSVSVLSGSPEFSSIYVLSNDSFFFSYSFELPLLAEYRSCTINYLIYCSCNSDICFYCDSNISSNSFITCVFYSDSCSSVLI